MGAICGKGGELSVNEDAANKRISKEQQQASRQNEIVVKLLLLGTGDSGKTTRTYRTHLPFVAHWARESLGVSE